MKADHTHTYTLLNSPSQTGVSQSLPFNVISDPCRPLMTPTPSPHPISISPLRWGLWGLKGSPAFIRQPHIRFGSLLPADGDASRFHILIQLCCGEAITPAVSQSQPSVLKQDVSNHLPLLDSITAFPSLALCCLLLAIICQRILC